MSKEKTHGQKTGDALRNVIGRLCRSKREEERYLALQKLDEVKAEIEDTNMLTAQGMVKIVEVLRYLVEVSNEKNFKG